MGFVNYFSDTGTGSMFTLHILLWDLLIIFLIQALVLFTVHTLLWDLLIISLILTLVLCSLFTFTMGF